MNYDNLIKNWHIKASEEDYFSKFVFEYLAFIAFLKKKKFTSYIFDRDAIQLLKQDENMKASYLEKFQHNPELKRAWEKIKEELDNVPLGNTSRNSEEIEEIKWWNCSCLRLQDQTKKDKEKDKGIIHSLDDWENMVEFWYAIRNNLFHASKNPEDTRDKLVVQNGYITLRELVETFLNNEQR